jgi:hypothetical protein
MLSQQAGFLSVLISIMASVSSGDSLYMWDPHGHHLNASAGDGLASSAAKQYQHAASKSNLTARFADQFLVWDFGGQDVSSRVDCTLIRLPLRSASQGASSQLSKVYACWRWVLLDAHAVLDRIFLDPRALLVAFILVFVRETGSLGPGPRIRIVTKFLCQLWKDDAFHALSAAHPAAAVAC